MHQGKRGMENLEQFRARYTDVNATVVQNKGLKVGQTPKIETKNISNYTRMKSLKYSHIMEIQFYSNQLERLLPNVWDENAKNTFISACKASIHAEAKYDLHEGVLPVRPV